MNFTEAIEAFSLNTVRRTYMDSVEDELERAPLNRNYYRMDYSTLADEMVQRLRMNGVRPLAYNDLKLSPLERRSVNANIDFNRKLYRGLPRYIDEIMTPGYYVLVEGNRNNPNFVCYVYKTGGRIGGCAEILSLSRNKLIDQFVDEDKNYIRRF